MFDDDVCTLICDDGLAIGMGHFNLLFGSVQGLLVPLLQLLLVSMGTISNDEAKSLFNIRTITCFVELSATNLELEAVIQSSAQILRALESELSEQGYAVQTCRLVTNPFPEWMALLQEDKKGNVIALLDELLAQHGIEFCAVGPASTIEELEICRDLIVSQSHRLSCSVKLEANDVKMAQEAAATIQQISRLNHGSHVQNGLGNFRFCVSHAKSNIPFFPVAFSATPTGNHADCSSIQGVAIGLENGKLAQRILAMCGSLDKVPTIFHDQMASVLKPLEMIVMKKSKDLNVPYLGMDTSLNPSLDKDGSVAGALEELVPQFGGPGSLAAAAAITTVLQRLPIQRVGYCGLMLPVCEDARLVELAGQNNLRVADLLSISHVCGVGVDTVPIADDTSTEALAGLLLDVVGLAARWDKPLSCRVFPVPGKQAGEQTTFDDSPYMMNSKIFGL